jgi:hypothetical protein
VLVTRALVLGLIVGVLLFKGVSDGTRDTSGVMVGGVFTVGSPITVGEDDERVVNVGTELDATTEGMGVAVATDEFLPVKTNPITKAENRIPPINKNTSKIIASPEIPAAGGDVRPALFVINPFHPVDSILQSFCQRMAGI